MLAHRLWGWLAVVLAHWLWELASCRDGPPAEEIARLSCWPTGCGGWPAVVLPTGCGGRPAVALAYRLWGLAGCRAGPLAVGVGRLSC